MKTADRWSAHLAREDEIADKLHTSVPARVADRRGRMQRRIVLEVEGRRLHLTGLEVAVVSAAVEMLAANPVDAVSKLTRPGGPTPRIASIGSAVASLRGHLIHGDGAPLSPPKISEWRQRVLHSEQVAGSRYDDARDRAAALDELAAVSDEQ